MKYIGGFASELGISREALLGLGREDAGSRREEFCMTVLALKLSRRANAVSALHGQVSRSMWSPLYPGRLEDQVPIAVHRGRNPLANDDLPQNLHVTGRVLLFPKDRGHRLARGVVNGAAQAPSRTVRP